MQEADSFERRLDAIACAGSRAAASICRFCLPLRWPWNRGSSTMAPTRARALSRCFGNGVSKQGHRAAIGVGQSQEYPDECRLPSTVGPQITEGASPWDKKLHSVYGDGVPEALREPVRLDRPSIAQVSVPDDRRRGRQSLQRTIVMSNRPCRNGCLDGGPTSGSLGLARHSGSEEADRISWPPLAGRPSDTRRRRVHRERRGKEGPLPHPDPRRMRHATCGPCLAGVPTGALEPPRQTWHQVSHRVEPSPRPFSAATPIRLAIPTRPLAALPRCRGSIQLELSEQGVGRVGGVFGTRSARR